MAETVSSAELFGASKSDIVSSAALFKKGREVPFLVKAADFLTGHFPYGSDAPEVENAGGNLKFNVPPTSEVPAFQDPVFAAGMGIGAGAMKAAPLVGKLATGAREALGWATGGLSDVPKLAEAGIKGLAKAKSAKPLAEAIEKRQATGVLESITPEARVAGDDILNPAAKAAPKPAAKAVISTEELMKADVPSAQPPPVQPGATSGGKSLAEMTNQEWQDSRHVLRRLPEETKSPETKIWAEEQLGKYARTHEEQLRFAEYEAAKSPSPLPTSGGKQAWEKVYHGTTETGDVVFGEAVNKNNQIPFGAHFTADKVLAEDFASGATKGKVTGKGKIIEQEIKTDNAFDISQKGLYKEGSKEFEVLKEIADKSNLKESVQSYSGSVGGFVAEHQRGNYKDVVNAIDPNRVLSEAKSDIVRQVLKENGYDPVIKYGMRGSKDPLGMGAPVYTDAYVALDKSVLKSPSPLPEAVRASAEHLAVMRGIPIEDATYTAKIYHDGMAVDGRSTRILDEYTKSQPLPEAGKGVAKPLRYDPSANRHNGEKLTPGDILKDNEGNTYRLDRDSGFMLTVDQVNKKGESIGIKSFSVDPMDKTRYRELYKTGENSFDSLESIVGVKPEALPEASTKLDKGASISDFTKDLNPMQKGKVDKILSAKRNHDRYGLVTSKEMIDKLNAEGRTATIKEYVDSTAVKNAEEEISRIYQSGNQNIKAARVEELKDIIKNPPQKQEYRIVNKDGSFYKMTKTEYDYAKHLEGKVLPEAGAKAPPKAATPIRQEIVEPVASQGKGDPPITLESLHPNVQGGAAGKLPKYAESSAINLERLNTTDDVKQMLNGMTKQIEEKIGKHKQTWDETRAQAEALGWDTAALKKEWSKKGAFSAAEIDAARQTNLNSINDLHETLRALPADRASWTPEVRAKLLDAMDNIKVTSQAASEAGRALNIHKRILSDDPAFKDAAQLSKVLNALNGKGVKRTDDVIDALRDLDFNDIPSVNRAIYNLTKSPWQKMNDRVFELWINGLLSNPLTHIVNTTSNAMTLVYAGAERQIAAGLDVGRAALSGGKRELFFREGSENAFSMIKGLQDGWKRFATVLRKGDVATKLDSPPSALPEGIAKFLPTRGLAAEDAFFKGFVESQELNRMAYRQGRSEGLRGKELTQRISKILSSPTEKMLNTVVEKGRYYTFQKELGEIGNLVLKARNVVPGLKYFIPFVRTPANIMKFSLERTPLNFPRVIAKAVRGELKGGALSEELAKPLMGSMLGTTAYIMAAQGSLTGGYPEQKSKREEWQNIGKLPYSVKIGNVYYSYARVEPFATIIGLSADFKQLQQNMTENEQYNVAAGIAGAISNNVSNKTFMQGFSNLVEAVNDPGRYGKTFVKQLAGSVVPAVSGGITRAEDQYVRDARSILDTVKSRIPGMSETLPARFTVWGGPVKREGTPTGRFLSPVQVSTSKGSPIEKEVARLNIDIGYPSRRIKGEEIPAPEYWDMVRKSGNMAKGILNKMVTKPSWDTTPDEIKGRVIKSVVDKSRDASRVQIKR